MPTRQQQLKKRSSSGIFFLLIAGIVAVTMVWLAVANPLNFPTIRIELPGLPPFNLFSGQSCNFPIAYEIGNFDGRFNISENTFHQSVADAINRWQKATGAQLFTQNASSRAIRVKLVFDERQQETQMLKSLGLSIDQSKTSFEKIKETYELLKTNYATDAGQYNTSVKDFEAAQQTHNSQIAYWNQRGGTPKAEYNRLQAEGETLKTQLAELEKMRLALNAKVATLNQLAEILNQLATKLNLEVTKYNTVGQDIRKEFEAGVYQEDANGKIINIYQFESSPKLTDVLTHEFGHALGLEHNDNPASVMYRLNEGQNQKIIQSDIEALKIKCPNLK